MIDGHPDIVRIIVADAPYPDSLGSTGTVDPGRSPFWLVPQDDEVDIVAPANRTYDLDMHVAAIWGIDEPGSVALVARFDGVRKVFVLPKDRTWTVPVRLERGLDRVLLAISFRGSSTRLVGGIPESWVTVSGLSLTPRG
jgi:hypothetical protein